MRFLRTLLACSWTLLLAVEPGERSFVDTRIFEKLRQANVTAAGRSTDEEFLRRATLDLTGRLPTPAEIRTFTASADPNKRDALIERLLASPEFADRWTLWMGDWMQNTSQIGNYQFGNGTRTALHQYLLRANQQRKSLREIALDALGSQVVRTGGPFQSTTGAETYLALGRVLAAPDEDTYDQMFARAARAFLGLGHYDCLLCHSGRGHLEGISLWARDVTRTDAQQMAAFFSQTRVVQANADTLAVTDPSAGGYRLDTPVANRPARVPVNGVRVAAPAYGAAKTPPRHERWRESFAEYVVADRMFARNVANRLWQAMFVRALADPVDGLDPARLDPQRPPPAPWTLQASHPELLEELAQYLIDTQFDLRAFLRLLAQSSAYQLSSRYSGSEVAPLFARRYPRRLWAEEVHDAIVSATGTPARYFVAGLGVVDRAVQLPDINEPGSAFGVNFFLDAFGRGNRDAILRSPEGAVMQGVNLLSNALVTERVRVVNSPALAAAMRLETRAAMVEEVFLLTLSRRPSAAELAQSTAHLDRAPTVAAGIEDLAWVLINRVEFVFSY
jgi:hypothetical protein